MDSWREVAARVLADEQPERENRELQSSPSDELASAPGWKPGLDQLEGLRPPKRLQSGDHWNEIVQDAVRLDAEGWAERAVALGWLPIELFGIGPKSSDDYEGLAVWLSGRRLILIDEKSAMVSTQTGRAIFNRRRNPDASAVGAVYLWEFGR